MKQYEDIVVERLRDSINLKENIIKDSVLIGKIASFANVIASVIRNGNKIIICGNGGSASDALHFAGEIVGRFQRERFAWPAFALNSDVVTMTAIANDYGYDEVFARQVQCYVQKGDLFVGISTSGNSENVLKAAITAKELNAVTAALLGKNGGLIKNVVEYPIIIESENTARIQECHVLIIHILCELVEDIIG